MRWRWDQGRLTYFQFENICAIAKVLKSLDGLALDTKDDLQELNMTQKNLLNQRLLTDAVANAHGDKEALLTWVENYSNMLDKDKEQFRNILSTYVLDLPALRKKYGIVTVDKENNNTENAEETKAAETQIDTEEDGWEIDEESTYCEENMAVLSTIYNGETETTIWTIARVIDNR